MVKRRATPLKVAVATVAANIALTLVLMQFLAHVGIALGTALSAWLNAAILWAILRRRGHLATDARLRRRSLGVAAATALMALALWGGRELLSFEAEPGLMVRALSLAALIAGGGLLYLGAAQVLGGLDLRDLKRLLKRAPIDAPPPASP